MNKMLLTMSIVFLVVVALAAPAIAANPGSRSAYANCGTSHTMHSRVTWWDIGSGWAGVTLVDNAYFTDGASSSTVYFRFRNANGVYTSPVGPMTINGSPRIAWVVGNPGIARSALQVKWGSNSWATMLSF